MGHDACPEGAGAACCLLAAFSSIHCTVRGTPAGGAEKARTAMKVPMQLSTCMQCHQRDRQPIRTQGAAAGAQAAGMAMAGGGRVQAQLSSRPTCQMDTFQVSGWCGLNSRCTGSTLLLLPASCAAAACADNVHEEAQAGAAMECSLAAERR